MYMARMEARILHEEMTGKDLHVTSGRRPQRAGGSSKHGTGEAMDIRVWYLGSAENQHKFADELQRRLGEDFDVVVEGPAAKTDTYKFFPNGNPRPPHIHVEYDPKGRHLVQE
jgi:hypothetical protein